MLFRSEAQGKLAEAEDENRQALAIRRKLLPSNHPDVAASLHNLAGVQFRQDNLAESESSYREALAAWQKLLPNNHPTVALALNNLAQVLAREGKLAQANARRQTLAEAEEKYRQALAIRERLFGASHPDVLATRRGLADVLDLEGKDSGTATSPTEQQVPQNPPTQSSESKPL